MKKLRLSIEELTVETFDVDAARNAWEGTVEGQADPRTYTSPAPDDCPCTIPSQGQTVAACAPTGVGEECETGFLLCSLSGRRRNRSAEGSEQGAAPSARGAAPGSFGFPAKAEPATWRPAG